jgi:hypothetical protein
MDLHDVGVLQASDGLRLDAEAGQVCLAGVCPRQDHLEGHDAVQLDLPGLVDDAHAAAAQLTQNLVARRRCPGWEGRGCPILRIECLPQLGGEVRPLCQGRDGTGGVDSLDQSAELAELPDAAFQLGAKLGLVRAQLCRRHVMPRFPLQLPQ